MYRSNLKYTMLVATVAGCLAAGTAFAQAQPTTPAQQATPGYSSAPTQMAATTPSKSETAPSAFDKLDASHSGFVTREQTTQLDGFDKAFTQADKNKDGKLSQDEFTAAWAIYTGKPQS